MELTNTINENLKEEEEDHDDKLDNQSLKARIFGDKDCC